MNDWVLNHTTTFFINLNETAHKGAELITPQNPLLGLLIIAVIIILFFKSKTSDWIWFILIGLLIYLFFIGGIPW